VTVLIWESPTEGFTAFQSKLRWDGALSFLPAPSAAEEALWPSCTVAARANNWLGAGEPTVLHGCAPLQAIEPSDFTGPVLRLHFVCAQSGEAGLSLVPRDGDPQLGTHFVGASGLEVLPSRMDGSVVACVEAGDADADGCLNITELGSDEMAGGRRDPNNFWDFFDVPAGPELARDGRVTVSDVVAVAAHFGSFGDSSGGPRTAPPPDPAYHPAFDRTLPLPEDAWDTGPPDGIVAIDDVVYSIAQFGHGCQP
jgi:hypothetical protein